MEENTIEKDLIAQLVDSDDSETETIEENIAEKPEKQVEKVEKPASSKQPTIAIGIKRKFEIAIYDEDIDDNTGETIYRPVSLEKPMVIEATSPSELKEVLAQFTACGQKAKIIRELDPPTKEAIEKARLASKKAQIQQEQRRHLTNAKYAMQQDAEQQYAEKPKFYRIGDIDIKNDNGKIYQKQWIKLSDSEASNFRIINDKNNAIVKLIGKHLEMKKWILVEDNNADEATNLQENIK